MCKLFWQAVDLCLKKFQVNNKNIMIGRAVGRRAVNFNFNSESIVFIHWTNS